MEDGKNLRKVVDEFRIPEVPSEAMSSSLLPAKARLADHLIDGGLEQLIRNERANGSSFDAIARSIWAATDQQVEVTGVSVMAWSRRLGIDTARLPSDKAAS